METKPNEIQSNVEFRIEKLEEEITAMRKTLDKILKELQALHRTGFSGCQFEMKILPNNPQPHRWGNCPRG